MQWVLANVSKQKVQATGGTLDHHHARVAHLQRVPHSLHLVLRDLHQRTNVAGPQRVDVRGDESRCVLRRLSALPSHLGLNLQWMRNEEKNTVDAFHQPVRPAVAFDHGSSIPNATLDKRLNEKGKVHELLV